MRFLIAFLLLSSTAHAQLVAKIDGPTTAGVGELIELKAAVETGTVAWALVQSVPYRNYENGSVLVFAAPRAGRYEAIAFIAVATADGKILLTSQRHAVQVGGGPEPPVPPSPPPVPPPPTPFSELSEIARSTAAADKRADVKLNFRTVATMAAAGTVPTFEQMVSETAQRNRASVGDATPADHPWNPFFSAVGKKLAELKSAGKLATKTEWIQAWTAIAEAL